MISICTLLRICLLLYGALFLMRSILSLAKRSLTESFCVFWSVLSVLMIVAGFLLHPVGLDGMISFEGFVLVMLAAFAIMEAAYYLSQRISMLERMNRELTMQVALLLNDVKTIETELEKREQDDIYEETAAVRHQYHGLRRSGNRAAEPAEQSVAQ